MESMTLQFSVQLRRNLATAKPAAEIAIIKKLRDQRIDNAEQYRMAGFI